MEENAFLSKQLWICVYFLQYSYQAGVFQLIIFLDSARFYELVFENLGYPQFFCLQQ